MTDSELTTKLEELRLGLANCQTIADLQKSNAAYYKSQIKVFEKELKRREKWAEKTNGKQE